MNLKRVRIQMYELSKQNLGGKTNWYLLVIEKKLLLKFYINKIFYPMERATSTDKSTVVSKFHLKQKVRIFVCSIFILVRNLMIKQLSICSKRHRRYNFINKYILVNFKVNILFIPKLVPFTQLNFLRVALNIVRLGYSQACSKVLNKTWDHEKLMKQVVVTQRPLDETLTKLIHCPRILSKLIINSFIAQSFLKFTAVLAPIK